MISKKKKIKAVPVLAGGQDKKIVSAVKDVKKIKEVKEIKEVKNRVQMNKPQNRIQSNTQSKIQDKSQGRPQVQPKVQSQVQPKVQPQVQPQVQPKLDQGAEKKMSGSQAGPQTGSQAGPQTGSQTGSQAKTEGRTDKSSANQNPNQPQKRQIQNAPRIVAQPIAGYLDIMPDKNGVVRPKFVPSNRDAHLPSSQIKRLNLRYGDLISGFARPPKRDEKNWGMVRIDKVNGQDLSELKNRLRFRDLVPIYPEELVTLETESHILSTRIIDLFSPIGFGQRGMLVSPPKAGKTTLLKEIAAGVTVNYPEIHLMAVLVGERPEEVTDLQRFIKGEVVASSFDQKPEEQTRAAEIAIERAKRLVEMGRDVFMVFDSITRLARAYNLAIPTSGRTLSGGFDPAALYPSKKFFGAARNIENGGSLTIIGTALVDTGSKMDDLIFEEFKGTGNMELWLSRELAEKRVFPAFDLNRSGTRKEELLLDEVKLKAAVQIRRMLDAMGGRNGESSMAIIEQMRKTKNNNDFMAKLNKNKAG